MQLQLGTEYLSIIIRNYRSRYLMGIVLIVLLKVKFWYRSLTDHARNQGI